LSVVKGFTVPRSPLGLAAIDPPPPWYYSGDVLGAEFWADPAATAALLPEGLTPDPETNGHAALMFVDWQFTASNDDYLDPARYQYREAFVTIDARWGEMKVTFCPFIYVDNDAAMVRGWTQGFPKQLGSICQTRTFAARSPATAPVEPGGRFAGSLSCHGQRLADVKVILQQTVADPTTLFNRPSALLRYFPRLEKDKLDKPAVNELTLSLTDNLQIVDLWIGAAEISFPDVPNEELSALKPVKVGAGFRYGLAYSVTDLRILKDFTV
jgi:hypothetical protein